MTRSYQRWREDVTAVLDEHYGIAIMDVDLPYREWFEDEIQPNEVVELADEELVEAGYLSKEDVQRSKRS